MLFSKSYTDLGQLAEVLTVESELSGKGLTRLRGQQNHSSQNLDTV